MTDPESPENKNEQELNLFADQTRPEDADAVGAAEPEADIAEPEADIADIPSDDATVIARTPAAEPEQDGSPVIAPPPPRRQQTVVRPGIVAPSRPLATFAQPAGTPAAPASPVRDAGHKPLPQPIREDQTLGQTLTAIRNARGLSLEEVALSTRIRMEYLLELEADELLKTLPSVYVSAYVRKLGEVYDLSREDGDLLIEKVRGETPHDHPDELPNKLIESVNEGGIVDEEETKRFKKLTIVFFSLAAIFVIALVLLVVHLVSGSSSSSAGRAPGVVQSAEEPLSQTIRIDESELESLIAPEMPSTSILKMSKTPGIRDTP